MKRRYPQFFSEVGGEGIGEVRMKKALRVATRNVNNLQFQARRTDGTVHMRTSRRSAVGTSGCPDSMHGRRTEMETNRVSIGRNPVEKEEEKGGWEEVKGDTVRDEDGDINKNTGAPCPDTAVWDFLESCNPPMTHLYEPLVDFGWINGEYLTAVIAWPAPIVQDVLGRFREWPGSGGRVTVMDVQVLWYHLTHASGEA